MGGEIEKNHKTQNMSIVFVADHWEKFYGGIDVFNQKLCEAMSYVVDRSSATVVCLVFDNVENYHINRCLAKGIYVIPYIKYARESEEEVYKSATEMIKVRTCCDHFIWIGHDIQTGDSAYKLSKMNDDKFGIIFHTDYLATHTNEPLTPMRREIGTDYQSKYEKQRDLAQKANWIFCVGPVVYKSFKYFERAKEIIPGLDVQKRESAGCNTILTAGRFSSDNGYQKNWPDVLQAIREALDILKETGKRPGDYRVIVYGFSKEIENNKLEEMKKNAISQIAKESRYHIKPIMDFVHFDSERKEYLKAVSQSGIFVMSSGIESFGLVAWEALGMGVPIVISENSGIYQYMKRELGYLLRGLCGSFEAASDDMSKTMGQSIADILNSGDAIKPSTELLQKEMSRRNKWETLAIDIAQTIGVPNVMKPDIFQNQNCFEFTYAERRLMLEELKKQVQSKVLNEKIVFFDGISSKNILHDRGFLISLAELMCATGKEKLEVYFSYPAEKAVHERVGQLNNAEGANVDTLMEKARKISKLKDTLRTVLEKSQIEQKKFESCLRRIHLVPLGKSPSVYINILDNDWYFTLKYENRSSSNATMKLADTEEGKKQKQRLIDHMKFILQDSSGDDIESQNMLCKIDSW